MGADPLRVGYVLKKFPRLSETFVLDEILALEEAGVEVSVFSVRLPDEGRFHSELGRLRAEVRYLPAFGSSSTLDAFTALRDLGPASGLEAATPGALDRALRFVDGIEPSRRATLLVQALHLARLAVEARLDHLHAHFATVAAHAAYLAHLFSGVPFSITAHAKDVYRRSVDPAVFREMAGAARAIVTVCEANRRYLRHHLLDGVGRVELVYNGLRLDEMRSGPGSPREPRLVLGVGRLVEKKGYDVLLDACRILAARRSPFRCVILGDGEERGRLLARRAELGLEDLVELPGPASRDEVLRWMRRARVLAAPCVTGDDGNRDALPTVLLEAMAVGLPAVSTPVGGIPEILEHGVEGLLVPERDPEALADALDSMLGDDGRWSAMAAAGPTKAARRFDRRRTLPGLLEVFTGAPAAADASGVPA